MPLPGWGRSVRKHVAEVTSAACTDLLHPEHSVAGVADPADMTLLEGPEKARPAGARIKFCAGLEKRQTAELAGVHAVLVVIEENTAEGSFGAMLEQHVPLFAGKTREDGGTLRLGGWRQVEAGHTVILAPHDGLRSRGERLALVCLAMLATGTARPSLAASLAPCPGCELLIGVGTTFSATFSPFEWTDGLVLPVMLELDGSRWEFGAYRFASAQRAPALPATARAANPYWGFTAMRRWAVWHRRRTRLYLGFGANYRSELDYLEATRWNFAYLVGVRLDFEGRELELGVRHWSDAWIRPPNRGENFLTLSFGF